LSEGKKEPKEGGVETNEEQLQEREFGITFLQEWRSLKIKSKALLNRISLKEMCRQLHHLTIGTRARIHKQPQTPHIQNDQLLNMDLPKDRSE